MQVYYKNSNKTKRINFDRNGYEISDIDAFRHEFQHTAENDRITEFKKGIQTFSLKANVTDQKNKSWKVLYDEMIGTFDLDVSEKKAGTLHINESYMKCFIYASTPEEVFEDWGFQTTELKIITDDPTWITEKKLTFFSTSISGPSASGLDFPFDFPFDFAPEENETEYRTVDHYAPSHFKMLVYGPCVNPKITINGYPRQVFTTLESNEYMVIDSRENSVTKYLANGTTQDIYNSRQFTPSIFEKIPGGQLTFNRSGAFGYEVTFYLERSEPKW